MKPGGLKRGVWLLLALACTSPAANAAVPAGIVDTLRARAASQGEVRLIVQFEAAGNSFAELPATARSSREQQIASLQQNLASRLRHPGLREVTRFRTIPFMVFAADAAAIDQLANLPDVIGLQEDVVEYPTLASSIPVIGADTVWAQGFDGTGQVIAVLDTGVSTSHPYFPVPKLKAEACFSTQGSVSGSEISASFCPGRASSSTAPGSGQNCNISGCDHGTHVAGIAVGNKASGSNIGVARGAGLIAIQVFSCFANQQNCVGSPYLGAYVSDQIKGLEHVLTLKDSFNVAAVNISIGSNTTYSNQTQCNNLNAARKAAIDNLRAAGIATVIAAGNGYNTSGISQPGCISSAISVGNTTDGDAVSESSNVATFLNLLAPGTTITSAVLNGQEGNKTGTSMATPHVAGAFAVIRQKDPSASVNDILQALSDTGTPVNDERPGGTVTNMRRINLDLALNLFTVPKVVTSPVPNSIIELGNIPVGNMGAPVNLMVSNSGEEELTLSCGTSGPQAGFFVITACPATIAPAANSNVSLRCDPTVIGALSATLTLATNDASNPQLTYTLQCTGLGVEISTLPTASTTLAFGGVLYNAQSSAMSVQVSNIGNQPLTLGCSLAGTNPGKFAITACPASVVGGGQSPVSVSCQPAGLGSFSATLQISSNDADESLLSFPLSCTGVAPEIASNPVTGSNLDFGVNVVNVDSAGQLINLSNSGDGALLLSCSFTGANAGSFKTMNCPASIPAGNQVNLEVRCAPQLIGPLAAQLQISSNDQDEGLLQFDLACAGVAPEFDPDPVAGTAFNFGTVYIGEPGPVHQLQVHNNGTSALALACDFTGAAADSYQVNLCPGSIAMGEAATVEFECVPATAGSKVAQLRLVTDDGDEQEALYPLSCEAVIRPENVFTDGFEETVPDP